LAVWGKGTLGVCDVKWHSVVSVGEFRHPVHSPPVVPCGAQEIAIADDLAKHDASFVFHPSLAAFGEGFGSYEAVNSPNFFLRHQDSRLKLQERPKDGDPAQRQFDLDASFAIVDGQASASPAFGGEIHSLRAVNFDMCLRHRDFHLFLTEINTNLDRLDATFEIQDGFV
jgi:hypothetical protein